MPFTLFHLGPALGFGLPFRTYFHAPTFLLANILVDVEPLLVLFLGLNYPLHGYLHTFIIAFFLGLALGVMAFLSRGIMRPFYGKFLLETKPDLKIKSFVVAGASGTMLHVLFDAPLYRDIKPFYPLVTNPLLGSVSSINVYSLSALIGVFGLAFYAAMLMSSRRSKSQK